MSTERSFIHTRNAINFKAYGVLSLAVAQSIYARCLYLGGNYAVRVEDATNCNTFHGDAGAMIHIEPREDNADGRPHFILYMGFHAVDDVWSLYVTDIERQCFEGGEGQTFATSHQMPDVADVLALLDNNDDFLNATRWEELDGLMHKALIEFHVAELASDPTHKHGSPGLIPLAGVDDFDQDNYGLDVVNMLKLNGETSKQELRDWVADLSHRCGIDTSKLAPTIEELIAMGTVLEDRHGSEIFKPDDSAEEIEAEQNAMALSALMRDMLVTFCRDSGFAFDDAESLLKGDLTERQRGWLECFYNVQQRAL